MRTLGEGDLATQVEQCYGDVAAALHIPEHLVEIEATANARSRTGPNGR